ncbi:hypothetical protein GC089_09450 [Cellulomonas sp. JZ18]|uniref:cation:proton antiporter domain-containing protein n=1 Tax=Cellulomonas sp. JZ18 TaxID=2654191 RepID=UPI0012D4001D|nr:cation:proton antiporter [Cellulomonas sp. JZ18]QGQ19410.1 hypothetical protein GC089_09450 [Cellulomonas sp. JZ18]
MRWLYLGYAAVGGTALALAVVSRPLRRLPVSEPLAALLVGVVLGPQVLGAVTTAPPTRDLLLLESARLLLAASVMAAALRFPVGALRPLVRPLVVLLAVVMPLAALVSAGAAVALGLPVGLALVVGACLSPTDPVLAASVVTGEPAERGLPRRLRALLTAESGANDGLALPLVGMALVAVVAGEEPATAGARLLWEVLGSILVGVAGGAAAAAAVTWANRRELVSEGPRLVLTLLLAVSVLGVARLAHTDGVLAAFVAGLAYNARADDAVRAQQEGLDEAVNRYAVLPFFALLGAVLPWEDWTRAGWPVVTFALAVLVLRRLPVVLSARRALRLPALDAGFAGWFGPMGVSAVFYLAHSARAGVHDPRLFAWGVLPVVVSVVAFGVSASPGVAVRAARRPSAA